MKNKKRLFGVIVGLLSIALCGMLLAGCGKEVGTQGDDTEVVSSQSTEGTEKSNTETETESVAVTEEIETTEEEPEKELPEEAENSLQEEETILTIKPTNDDVNNGSGNKEKYEAPVAASADSPIVKVATEEVPIEFSSGQIPAGKMLYYKITATKGNYMSIADENAYIVYDGKQYNANAEGIVLFEIQNDVSVVAIGNKANAAQKFMVSIDKPPLGSAGNPYVVDSLPDDGVVLSSAVTAGSTVYYKVSGVSEMVLTIEDETAYVIYNGKKYTPDADGVVSVEIGKIGGPAVFQIGNSSKTGEATYEMQFTYSLGSEKNPIELDATKIPGSISIDVPAGKTVYYASYNISGMELSVVGEAVSVIHQGQTYNAENGIVSLTLGTATNRQAISFGVMNTGIADATYTVTLEYSEGTYNNPTEIEVGNKEHVFEAGDDCYYYQWTASTAGTMTFDISGTTAVGWQYSISNGTDDSGAVTHFSDDETVVSNESHSVNAGDVLIIKIGTYGAEAQTTPAGTISFTISFTEGVNTVSTTDLDVKAVETTGVVETTEVEEATETEIIY